ncbi:alpha/beta fold hydrolase [Sporosarcina globispora]|uniref:alpha/beta fold hydrolase n=1 Tax=Sporosarcina globispora TaxID=1459 RepID=UPI000AA9A012|nr:alpha/beta fold hydrolase [Sporosarcina globispora]
MYADLNGTRIFFDIEGVGWKKAGEKLVEQPVCFILHGGPGGTHLGFKPHFGKLAETAQLVYIDNRGSGLSDRGPQTFYSLENNVEDIEALRKHLGLKKIYILGHSYGGMTALSYAVKYQQNLAGLLLLATSASCSFLERAKSFIEEKGDDAQKRMAEVLWEGAFLSQKQLMEYYEVMAPLYSKNAAKHTQQTPTLGNRCYEALNEGFGNFLRTYDVTGQLPFIKVPTLVMAGRHDWITPVEESERIAELIPDSVLKVFENSSHSVPTDEPAFFFKTVSDFISTKGGKRIEEAKSLKGFEAAAEKLAEKYSIPGTFVALAEEGEFAYGKGFGFRDVEAALPINVDTVFGIGSITKSFTCAAIMLLQEQGRLSVNDRVVKYLPEFKIKNSTAYNKMTIHHFMTHSAGLPPLSSLYYALKRTMEIDPSVKDHKSLQVDEEDLGYIDTYEELLDFIGNLDIEMLGDPGKHFSYSNDCYALLGSIIERVSGKSYEQFVYDHILQPCGMDRSFFTIEEYGEDENIAMSYAADVTDNGKKVYQAPVWWDAPAMRAAGFLKSTAADMLKYAEIFRNGGVVNDKRILTEKSVEAMLSQHIEIEPGKYYGYGFMIAPDYFGAKLVQHGGNLKAIAAQLSILPEKALTGVTFTNLAAVPAPRIMEQAINVFQGRDANCSSLNMEEVELSAEVLAEFSGEYVSNEGMKVVIGVRDGKPTLMYQEAEHTVRAVGDNLLLATVSDMIELIQIHRDENGKVARITCHYREFPKVSAKQNISI